MRKTYFTLSFFIIIMLSFSCKKEVNSCIEMSSSSIASGQSITFTSCSENALSYDWRMSGPDAAPENNLGWSDKVFIRTFTEAENYTVTLTTYSDFSLLGESTTSTTNFTVN